MPRFISGITSSVVQTLPLLKTMAFLLNSMHKPYNAISFGHVLGLASFVIQFLNIIPRIPRQAVLAFMYHSSLLLSSAINLAFTALPSSV